MVSIPLSVLIGVTGLYLVGFSINQLSIVGAVIALGLLVDDSIVVVENISRWVRGGKTPFEASIEATRQIGPAVTGCTATLIFAFLPLMFLPGKAGQYIRTLPVTVSFIVLGSLFVALTIIPFIASKVLKANVDPRGNIVLRGFHKVIDLTYNRALQWSLNNPYKTVLFALILFTGSIFIIKIIGLSLFPKAGLSQFLITVETPRGSNIKETDKAVKYVESVLAGKPEVVWYMSNIGKGNPMIYYNTYQKSEQATTGEVLCEIKRDILPEIERFINDLRDTLNNYVNAKIYVKEFENGMPVDAPVALRIVGNNLDTLKHYSLIVEDIFRSNNATMYIKNPLSQSLTELHAKINLEKAGMFGVPSVEIDRAIRLSFAGIVAGRYRDAGGKEYSINVRLPVEETGSLVTFENIYVSSLSGAQIPLSQLARIEFSDSPTLIQYLSWNSEHLREH
ncbi:MAG: acriflavin resistance protein [Bacteroidetes bacterium]|nr:acriflavin resistance protein [Bacteroidota bacterium]